VGSSVWVCGVAAVQRFAEMGFTVLGFDTDAQKVEKLNRGNPISNIFPPQAFRPDPGQPRRFTATTTWGGWANRISDHLRPTPWMSTGSRTCNSSWTPPADSGHLRPGQMVSLESTTYPGLPRKRCCPVEPVGLTWEGLFPGLFPGAGRPGESVFQVNTIPRSWARHPACRAVGEALYGQVVNRVWRSLPPGGGDEQAAGEYLPAVNIALVNELKMLCLRMGLDIFEVIEASKTKRSASRPSIRSGFGRALHSIDPFYLTWKAGIRLCHPFIELAGTSTPTCRITWSNG